MRKISIALALAVLLPAFASNLHAQTAYTFTKIAETADVSLCTKNVPTTINHSGTVAFNVGRASPTGGCVFPPDRQWNWTGDGGTPVLIYPLDDQGWFGLGPGVVLASGEMAFVANNPLPTGDDDTAFIYLGNGGPPTLVATGAFSGLLLSANDGGAMAVVSSPRFGPYRVLRYDAPFAAPVVIDSSNSNNVLSPFTALNASLEVAFAKGPNLQPNQVLKGSGAGLTLIAQAGVILNGLTLNMFDDHVAIRDDGFVAFQGQGVQPGTGIYLGNGTQTIVVVDTQGVSPFQYVNYPALNNAGQVAFYGVMKSASSCPGSTGFCEGIYTGPDPVADKVIQSGDTLDGMTVLGVGQGWPPSLNEKGQIAVGVSLIDSVGFVHNAIYRADPPNKAPVLTSIGNKTVAELASLAFSASASDPDSDDVLTFSLDAGAPTGASITSSGAFSWTPTEAQGPGTYAIGIRVSDNGNPVESDAEVISVQVSEVNRAPTLAAIGDKTVKEGATLTFTASASDADLPGNALTFSLGAGSPAGAAINPTTGVFSWKPSNKQGPASYAVTVRVTDNGSPQQSASQTITITVTKRGDRS